MFQIVALVLLALTPAESFTHVSVAVRPCSGARTIIASSATADAISAYEKIGIAQEELALGVDANEFAEFIGT